MGLGNLARSIGRKATQSDGDIKDDDAMDIIEFIESPFGLGFSKELSGAALFPVQRFILKMFYNLKLDDEDPYIRVPKSWRHLDRMDPNNEGQILPGIYHEFTEVKYLEYLYEQGRCNIKVQDHDRREMILPIGRRSGKSTISAMIAAYETYKLLRKYNPQKYYGTPESAPIQICSLATSREQAAILYKEVRRHFSNCQFFQQYMYAETQTQATFHTPRDLEIGANPSLRLTFYSAVAKGVRGAANIAAIMDEVAFFAHTGQASAYEVYQALSPSLAQFSPKDPKDSSVPVGDSHGRMIMISSPYARQGLFYDQYAMALSGTIGAKSLLMIQAPTWEVNPTIPLDYYEKEYAKNPVTFHTEFGAEFTDKVKSWIERDEDLIACVDPHLKPATKGAARERHYLGLDLAPRGDRTVIALSKVVDDKVRLVYHEQWQAKTSWYDLNPHLKEPLVPYAKGLETVETLDYEEVSNWIDQLSKRFYIAEGVFDRFEGIGFEQILHKRGLHQLRVKHFTASESSEIYQAFKILMFNEMIELYDYVLEDDDPEFRRQGYSPYIQELLELQGTARGKHLISVEGPQVAGKYDDFSDALVRAIWLGADRLTRRKSAGRKSAGPAQDMPSLPRSMNDYQRKRKRRRNYNSKRNPNGGR